MKNNKQAANSSILHIFPQNEMLNYLKSQSGSQIWIFDQTAATLSVTRLLDFVHLQNPKHSI
jgi:hypothetical protein